jgi:hypothetical protein
MAGMEFIGKDEDEAPQAARPSADPKATLAAASAAADIQDPEAMQAAAAARTRLSQVVERVRADSRTVVLTDPAVFAAEPYSFTEEDLDEVWTGMAEHAQYSDIVRTRDSASGIEYLHSEMLITVPYAKYMLRSQANDPVRLIVETTREFSELYPQSISVQFFELDPFNLRRRDILASLGTIASDPAYKDIKTIEASNAVVYLYSDRYMTEKDAKKHADWVEVDRYIYQ